MRSSCHERDELVSCQEEEVEPNGREIVHRDLREIVHRDLREGGEEVLAVNWLSPPRRESMGLQARSPDS